MGHVSICLSATCEAGGAKRTMTSFSEAARRTAPISIRCSRNMLDVSANLDSIHPDGGEGGRALQTRSPRARRGGAVARRKSCANTIHDPLPKRTRLPFSAANGWGMAGGMQGEIGIAGRLDGKPTVALCGKFACRGCLTRREVLQFPTSSRGVIGCISGGIGGHRGDDPRRCASRRRSCRSMMMAAWALLSNR